MSGEKSAERRHVLLCVSGGISAYKAVEVLRLLQKAGLEVRVACTEDALQFVGKATWEGLTHVPVATSLVGWPLSAIPHVDLAGWADAVLVAPATANLMAKMVAGIADNVVSAALLAVPASVPVVVAPAMNVHMWQAPATRHNVEVLQARGICLCMPAEGRLACGDVGQGKLAKPEYIATTVLSLLNDADTIPARPLAGRTVLITAGPTHEAIDPVRYIANRSSGKMGFALASEAAARGARVLLVAGPVSLPTPEGVERTDVTSAAEMHAAATQAFAQADAAICAAAVADYTPAHPADHKLKKAHEHLEAIELVETADILAELGRTKTADGRRRVVVGFAAETNDLLANAEHKLAAKGADLIVANDVTRADSGFGTDTNRVSLIDTRGIRELPTLGKDKVAACICDALERLFAELV